MAKIPKLIEPDVTAGSPLELRPTACAICGTRDNARPLYLQRLDGAAFRAQTFSARRLPDRRHYRVVRCDTCDLVRSDPAASPELLVSLYRESSFDYQDQIPSLRYTYRQYLQQLDRYRVVKGSLLEIGCGNGFFLDEALEAGYADVRGIEPSAAAIAEAPDHIRASIVCDVMRPGLFDAAAFDVICLFQVLDHLPDPGAVLDECLRALRPGGLILCLNHDVEAWSARLLKDRSPIVDVEHTYLYSRRTMRLLLSRHGFQILRVAPALNTYSLSYLAWLAPLPSTIKRVALAAARSRPLGRIRITLPLGNLYLIGRNPA